MSCCWVCAALWGRMVLSQGGDSPCAGGGKVRLCTGTRVPLARPWWHLGCVYIYIAITGTVGD